MKTKDYEAEEFQLGSETVANEQDQNTTAKHSCEV